METNRKWFEACNFLSTWLVKSDCTAQSKVLALHKYSLAYPRCAVYKKCTLCVVDTIDVYAPNYGIIVWSLVNFLCFFHY